MFNLSDAQDSYNFFNLLTLSKLIEIIFPDFVSLKKQNKINANIDCATIQFKFFSLILMSSSKKKNSKIQIKPKNI